MGRALEAVRIARSADPFGVGDIMNPIPGMLYILAITPGRGREGRCGVTYTAGLIGWYDAIALGMGQTGH